MRPKPGMNAGKNGVLVGAYNKHYRKAIVSEVRTPPQDGDMRIFMGMDPSGNQEQGTDPLEFAIQEYNGENWENRGNLAQRSGSNVVDMLLSGFCKVGEGVLTPPGRFWIESSNSFSGTVQAMAYGNEVVVAATGTQEIERSIDGGKTFSADIANNHTKAILVVDYGNGVFIAAGDDGELSRSTDYGVTWSALVGNAFATASDDIHDLAYGNSVWAAVGEGTTYCLISSNDGATWTAPTTAPTDQLESVTYCGNGVFLAVGSVSRSVWKSTDSGDNWTKITATGVSAVYTYGNFLGYGDGVVVAAWHAAPVGDWYFYYSVDLGVNWTLSTMPDPITFGQGTRVVRFDDIFACGEYISLDNGRSFIGASPNSGNSFHFPATPAAMAYDTDKRILSIGAASGETYYSPWLEAGAGIVEQGSNANGEYQVWSNGRVELTMWGFVTGDGAAIFQLDVNNTLPFVVSEVFAVNSNLHGYKASDPSTRFDVTGTTANVSLNAYYDGTYLDVRVFDTAGVNLINGIRYVWGVHMVGAT